MPYFRPMGDAVSDWAATQAALKSAPLLDPSTYAPPSLTAPTAPDSFSFTDPSTWKSSPSSNTLLYAAAGAVALWFLLRKKK